MKTNELPSIGVALHKVGEITQSLNFKYLYKIHCKSNKLLKVLYDIIVPLKVYNSSLDSRDLFFLLDLFILEKAEKFPSI
jgi:hypothetical protein